VNPKGNKSNLKASHPKNRNAEKSGLHSERRRAEKAREVLEDMKKDPEGFIAQDLLAELAATVGLCELLAEDIAERGVTDRDGNLRRVVGSYRNALKLRRELAQQIEANLASAAAEKRNTEPWTEGEGLRLLRNIAHSYGTAPGASVAAIKHLLEREPSAADDPVYQFYKAFLEDLFAMSDEDLEREVKALLVPVTTGQPRGPGAERQKVSGSN
jgi:hypothetical protein